MVELPSTSHQSQQTEIGLEARVRQKEDHVKPKKSFPSDIASQLPSGWWILEAKTT